MTIGDDPTAGFSLIHVNQGRLDRFRERLVESGADCDGVVGNRVGAGQCHQVFRRHAVALRDRKGAFVNGPGINLSFQDSGDDFVMVTRKNGLTEVSFGVETLFDKHRARVNISGRRFRIHKRKPFSFQVSDAF